MAGSLSKFVTSPKDRYELLRPLGGGATASTWLARSAAHSNLVVIKELKLAQATDWDAVALFEREAEVLRGLDHEAVPRLIEAFKSERDAAQTLVLSWIDGRTLRERMDQGPGSPREVQALLTQGLELLVWLHGRVPPVVHRDITPRNILLVDSPTGPRLRLVDFGAVKTAVGTAPATGAETVGTFGYMAPEQLLGQGEPRSDLHGLGMSMIAFSFGRDALELPAHKHGRVQLWRLAWRLPYALRATLEAMTEPELQRRPASAEAALRLLRQGPPRGPRIAKASALSLCAALLSGYAATRAPHQGEMATLGGWFSGHGRIWSDITATFAAKPGLLAAPANVTHVGFSPDGRYLASATTQGEVIVWDVAAGEELWRLWDPQFSAPDWACACADGSAYIAAAGQLLHLDRAKRISSVALDGEVLAAALTPEAVPALLLHRAGNMVVVAAYPDRLEQRYSLGRMATPRQAALSPDGRRVAWVNKFGEARLWQEGHGEVQVLVSAGQPQAVALGNDAAVVTAFSHVWWFTSVGSKKFENFASLSDVVAVAPDGRRAAISPLYASKTAVLYSPEGVASAGLKQRGRISALAFSPDGSLLAAAGEDQRVRLWRAKDVAPPQP